MKNLYSRLETLENRTPNEIYVKIFKDDEEKIVSAKSYYYDYLPKGWGWGDGVQSGSKLSDMAYLLDGIAIQTDMSNGISYEDAVARCKASADGSAVDREKERNDARQHHRMLQNATNEDF